MLVGRQEGHLAYKESTPTTVTGSNRGNGTECWSGLVKCIGEIKPKSLSSRTLVQPRLRNDLYRVEWDVKP